MNVVYLSPHFPRHYTQFAERLAAHGVQVLGITDQHDHELSRALRGALTGHYRVHSLGDVGQVLGACHFFRERFGTLSRVESPLEPWIELEGQVRDVFGIPGKKTAELAFIKRKSLMKDIFQRAGVPTARGTLVESLSQCREFIGGRFPVFVKPDIGVGAADTYTLRRDEDLVRFFERKGGYPYFMEEYLEGTIESFDGLTNAEGGLAFCTSHVFSNDIHKVVARNENLTYYSQRQVPPDLQAAGERVVAAADIREKFFHIEFFRLGDGTLRGLELNLRPPGGLTTHLFNYACDLDVYDWWARIVAGAKQPERYTRRYHCAYVSRKLDRGYRYSHGQLRDRLGPALMHFQEMSPIEHAVLGHLGYVVRHEDLATLKTLIADIVTET